MLFQLFVETLDFFKFLFQCLKLCTVFRVFRVSVATDVLLVFSRFLRMFLAVPERVRVDLSKIHSLIPFHIDVILFIFKISCVFTVCCS